MTNFKPATNPTLAQLGMMHIQIESLIQHYGISGLAHLCDVEPVTVRSWRVRKRISATAAHELCKLERVKNDGFTREKLRPDVKVWYLDQKE